MIRRICPVIAVFLVVYLGWNASGFAADAAKEVKPLQGDWVMTSIVYNGLDLPSSYVETSRLTIAGDKYIMTMMGQVTRLSMKFDDSTKPKQVDFTYLEGQFKDQVLKGIYEFDGTTLRICRPIPTTGDRPTSFDAPADSRRLLVAWRKRKPGDPAPAPTPKPTLVDRGALLGTWQLIWADKDGKVTADDVIDKIKVAIGEKSHTVTFGDQVVAHDVPYVLDETKTPKQVTDTIPDGPDKGKQIHSIFRLDDNVLFSCVAAVGKSAPTSFEAPEGSGETFRVFRRVKDKEIESAKAPKIADEETKFAGKWSFKSVKLNGKEMSGTLFKNALMTLKDNHFSTSQAGVVHEGVYIVDPTASPKIIDIVFTKGPDRGKVVRGVYSLEGDVYTICIGLNETTRPTALESKPGSGNVLEVLTREKP